MLLQGSNISKKYRSSRRQVLKSVDLSVDTGEFVAVMGESGSGKSTLLAILAGILHPDDGQVLLDGEDLYALTDEALSKIHREKIGYVPQSHFFLKNYTILENIVEPFPGSSERKEQFISLAKEYMGRLGIGELHDRFPHELSGGELKRAALVRAVLMEPKLLIADEPTTGLDGKTGERILTFLSEYVKNGHTVIVATHDEQVQAFADRIVRVEV